MLSRREVIQLGLAGAAWLASPASASAAESAAAVADKLVTAMGGRDAWAKLKGLGVAARHYSTDLPEPYDNQLYIAMEEPRMRFEALVDGVRRVRAVVGDRGWRWSETVPLSPMTPEQVKFDIDWWEAHVYRNVRRLAVRDPGVQPRLHTDGRLELYRPNGSRLMWYRLNQLGEPVAFGTFEHEVGSILGPLQTTEGGAKLPIFSASNDGSLRAVDQRPTTYATIPPVDFEKP
jgi:hypothetical protein